MREAHSDFVDAGAKVVAVSGKSASVARTLAPTMPFPLWLDPEHQVRRAFGLGKLRVGQMLSPASAVNYANSMAQARNLRVFPDQANQTPAVVVLDADQNVTWQHVGKALGDYPTIEAILRAL